MAEQEAAFQARDLISSAGVGSNGDKLVQTLGFHYPLELKAALLKRVHPELTDALDDKAHKRVASIAGVEKVRDVKVRGGDGNPEDAWVTYAFVDDRGDVVKGAFPHSDLSGSGSSDGHVSQRDSVAQSPAARDHRAAQAKARAAAPEQQSDPIAAYEDMSARDVAAYVEANPDRADVVEALERAVGGERKTVLDAVAKARAGESESGDGDPEGGAE